MNSRIKVWLRQGLFVLAAYIAASYVLTVTLNSGDFHTYYMCRLDDMIEGRAYRPFVYRTLAATTVRFLSSITPEEFQQWLTSEWNDRNLSEVYPIDGDHATKGVWTIVVMMASLIAIVFAMRRLLSHFYVLGTAARDALALSFMLSLPMLHSRHLYDYPHLLLMTISILLLAQRKWKCFYGVFLLTCISKETAIVVTAIFALNCLPRPNKSCIVHGAIQFALWTIVFVSVRCIFASNPGALTASGLLHRNLGVLTDPATYFDLNKYLLPIDFNILIPATTVFLVAIGWRQKPVFLKRSLAVLPMLLLPAMFIAWIEETRQYAELAPVVFSLMVPTLGALFGKTIPLRDPSTSSTSTLQEESPTHAGVHRAPN